MQVRKLKSCFLHWNEIFLQHMTNVRIKYGLKLWHVKRLQFLMEILSPPFALSWRICKLKKINHYLEETISFCSFLLQSSSLHLLAYNNMSEYVPSFCVRRLFVKTGKNGRNTTTRSNTHLQLTFTVKSFAVTTTLSLFTILFLRKIKKALPVPVCLMCWCFTYWWYFFTFFATGSVWNWNFSNFRGMNFFGNDPWNGRFAILRKIAPFLSWFS